MAGPYAAPLSTGFRRNNNYKNSNIKKSSIGINKRLYGKRISIGQSRYQSGGIKNVNRQSNENRVVRVTVSNLASSVVSEDLRELFDEFNPRNVSLETDNQGNLIGSFTVLKHNADRLIEKFDGKFALDGEILKISVTNTSSISSRIKLPNIQKRVHFTHSAGTQINVRDKNHKKQSQMTTEELDAELDAYMGKVN